MAKYSVTKLGQFVEHFPNAHFFVGVDVHKRSYHVAIRRQDGRVFTFVSPASPTFLFNTLEGLAIKVGALVYEAGPTGFSLARLLQKQGVDCLVAAPSRIPRAVVSGAKTDRLDCIRLAEYAAKGLIKPIAIPSEKEDAERALLRRRHKIVDRVRSCKQRIKSLLLHFGVEEPRSIQGWSQTATAELLKLEMEPGAQLTLQSLIRELEFYREEQKAIERCLEELMKKREHAKIVKFLRSVPGVGKLVSASFRLELFRPERFHRAEEVTSYLGLAPLVCHSGDRTPAGRLRPVGQKRLRSLLIEAAWIWRTKDPHAEQLYHRILKRTGISQKAIAAVARKLAVILWRLSVEQREYRIAQAA